MSRTPSQTVGPYFEVAIPAPGWQRTFERSAAGEWIRIEGRILDGAGAPVPDALIETWQVTSDHRGGFAGGTELSPAPGFARVPSNERGEFAIETLRPEPERGPDSVMIAPHLRVNVFARGLLVGLVTRIYFPGVNPETDPILALVPAARRSTLIAVPTGPGQYRFDITLQGPGETVFFDV